MHTDGWGRCDPRAQQQQPNPNLQLCAWTACARGRHVHVDAHDDAWTRDAHDHACTWLPSGGGFDACGGRAGGR
jgi:hypothetical protein